MCTCVCTHAHTHTHTYTIAESIINKVYPFSRFLHALNDHEKFMTVRNVYFITLNGSKDSSKIYTG